MSNRSLKIQLHLKDPRCFWCHRKTQLTNIAHIKGQPPKDMATVDHLISRFKPERWVKKKSGEVRKVLACFECNNRRSLEETKQLSKQELFLRGQGFCLNPKGKPVIEKPLDTLEEVIDKFSERRIKFGLDISIKSDKMTS